MDGWEKFEETSLPPKDAVYSSDQGHEHVQQVWNAMEKETLGCYHDTYLKTDVLLFADMFETFRNRYLKNYKLDPAHFYTAPGLAWQALLKTAAECCEHEKRRKESELCPENLRLELLTDINMLLMVEKGIQVGITQAVKRYAKANDKYMKSLYNPNELSIYLHCVDLNNLYGWTMINIYQLIDLNRRREKTLPLKKWIRKKRTREDIF